MNSGSNITALLPMKGNSERVPGKNFKIMNDKPLFKWILDKINSLNNVDEIIINTDVPNILIDNGIDKYSKVKLIQRPESICGDFVSMNEVINYDIDKAKNRNFLMTHTTNPFLRVSTLLSSMEKYIKDLGDDHDSLFSVNKFQTRFYDSKINPINHDLKVLQRTQDLEPWYEENSNFYFFSKESFRKNNGRIGLNPIVYECNKLESIDIDEQDDWDMAETLSYSIGDEYK